MGTYDSKQAGRLTFPHPFGAFSMKRGDHLAIRVIPNSNLKCKTSVPPGQSFQFRPQGIDGIGSNYINQVLVPSQDSPAVSAGVNCTAKLGFHTQLTNDLFT